MTLTEHPKNTTTAACVDHTQLYQHPLLEDGGSDPADRRLQSALRQRAAEVCGECPMRQRCLYDAVVNHDVAGFVAGTTPQQRTAIRRDLRVKVSPEVLDNIAGVSASNRPVDHQELVRIRKANPDLSLEQIAQRLGCSLSTVKRHLRKERSGQAAVQLTPVKPSLEQVVTATKRVLSPSRPSSKAA